MEAVLCVDFDGVFVHNAGISVDGKTIFRSRLSYSLHARDYVEHFSSDTFHDAVNRLSSENFGFESMITDIFRAVRTRAETSAKTTITKLKLFHSSHPNPDQDKKFVSAAQNAGFTSVQICSLATAIHSIDGGSCLPTVLLVHLRGTVTELSLVTFIGTTPAILYTETAPLGISQFANAAMKIFRRDAEERECSKDYFERMFMDHFFPPPLQDIKTEATGPNRHVDNASEVISNVLQNSFTHLADEVNQRLLYHINWWKRDHPDLRVLIVPAQLRTLLTKANGETSILSSSYESYNCNRLTYITELCKTTFSPSSAYKTNHANTTEILYEVYHPTATLLNKGDAKTPGATTWVSTLMTGNDLTKPQLPNLGICSDIFSLQTAPETFNTRYAENKLGQVIDIRLVQPNLIVTETRPRTTFGIKSFDIYKAECGAQIKKQSSLSFPVASDVRALIPNGWNNLYVAKDNDGFYISLARNTVTSVVCQWEGQFPSWYQWTSAFNLAYQRKSQLLITHIANWNQPFTFQLDNEIAHMKWKFMYEVEIQGNYLWMLLAKQFGLDDYGYPKSTGCFRILTKLDPNGSITISDIGTSSVVACTALPEVQYLSLALVVQQCAGNEYTLKRIGLSPESNENSGKPTFKNVQETFFWNTVFTLGEHDEPIAVHESTLYGLLFVVTSHNVILAFLTSTGRVLFRHVGKENFIKESFIIHEGQDEDLVLATQNNQVFSVKFDAKAVCTKALQLGETRFALDLMTAFQMRRTQEMFLATLSQMLPCNDWGNVANAIRCIDDVRHAELYHCFVEQFPDIMNVPAILNIMWNEYSLTDLENILNVFVTNSYAAGVSGFLTTVCRTEKEEIRSCKELWQSCVQAASQFHLTASLLELVQRICSNNPTFLPLNIMEILYGTRFFFGENVTPADLCERFVTASADRNEDEFLLQLLKTMSYHGIVALMNYEAKDELLVRALSQLTAVRPSHQTRIAEAVFDHARFDELMEWLQMYPTCVSSELATKIALALINSATHGALFGRFTTICDRFSLDEVIKAAALSKTMTNALWSIVARICLVRKSTESAVAILCKYPVASEKFGRELLSELRDTKSDAGIPWLKLAEYYDAVPSNSLQAEAMALLKRKAPDAVAYVYSKRGSYDEFRSLLAETRQTSQPETGDCVVCMEVKADCVYLPCGHVASCCKCAERTSACPLCRKESTG